MITRGYITEKLSVDSSKVMVRLPIFETANNNEANIHNPFEVEASIMMTPGNFLGYNVGDTVIVGFEDNDYSKPIILGKLFISVEENSTVKEVIDQVSVKSTAVLPENTSIGKVSPKDIAALSGINTSGNLAQQLKYILDKIDNS